MHKYLRTSWPYYGGKARVAALIWERFGDPSNFIDPFCGSAALLLARPHPPRVETVNDPTMMVSNFYRSVHPEIGDPAAVAAVVSEAINDFNPYVINAWRSIQRDPDGTARWANFPVDESYLHAVHRWLLLGDESVEFRARMRHDPDYFDIKRAGRWIFGICCWIGSGWCDERSQVTPEGADATSQQIPRLNSHDEGGTGVHGRGPADPTAKRPMLAGDDPGSYGKGVHARGPSEPPAIGEPDQRRPNLAGGAWGIVYGKGVHAKGPTGPTQKLPDIGGHCGGTGRGVHQVSGPRQLKQQRPHISGGTGGLVYGSGVHANPPESRPDDAAGTNARRLAWLTGWFGALSDRLRSVRVCCGDWERVCGSDSTTTRLGTVGLFMDPPYPVHTPDGKPSRAAGLYGAGDDAAAADRIRDRVLAYCKEHGPDPLFRIAVCGYDTDGYEALEALGWEVVAWRGSGGYSNQSKRKNINRDRERIWFSPSCIKPLKEPMPLFDGLEDD